MQYHVLVTKRALAGVLIGLIWGTSPAAAQLPKQPFRLQAAPRAAGEPTTQPAGQAAQEQAAQEQVRRPRIQLRVQAAGQPKAVPKKKQGPRRVNRNPAMAPVVDDPHLPRVLLIGDSISIGYTVPTRELLKGKANVHRPLTNCGPTTRGVEQLAKWLGDKPWDVIHFNWGLHDLKYMGPQGQNLADPKAPESRQQVPAEQYRENLELLVTQLKKTGAQLIWCATTPVPAGAKGRVVGDSAKYNKIAAEVMQKHGIQVNDLYGFAQPQLDKIQRKADVHFTPEGSRALAEQVAKVITAALARKSAAP